MVCGILGIIGCPMVDDNLVYNLLNDKEEKRIFVVNNRNDGSIRRKLDGAGIPFELVNFNDITSRVFELPKDEFVVLIDMIDLGLHSRPEELKKTVEELTEDMQPFVDCIGYYIATCGNFDWDIPKWCESKGYKPSAMFTDENGCLCHDCVGINIAGGPKYLEMQKAYPGHFYIFPGMATNFDDFMDADQAESKEIEACLTDEMRETLGIEPGEDGYLRWLLRQGNYEYILKLDTGLGDHEQFERDIVRVAERTQLRIRIPEDREWTDLRPTEAIYSKCKSFLRQD